MKCVSVDVHEIEREQGLLVSLFVPLNGEKRCDITLWILFLIEDNGDSVAARESSGLPNRTSAGFLLKINNVISMSFHGFDLKKDARNGWDGTISTCTIVSDNLEEIGGL